MISSIASLPYPLIIPPLQRARARRARGCSICSTTSVKQPPAMPLRDTFWSPPAALITASVCGDDHSDGDGGGGDDLYIATAHYFISVTFICFTHLRSLQRASVRCIVEQTAPHALCAPMVTSLPPTMLSPTPSPASSPVCQNDDDHDDAYHSLLFSRPASWSFQTCNAVINHILTLIHLFRGAHYCVPR